MGVFDWKANVSHTSEFSAPQLEGWQDVAIQGEKTVENIGGKAIGAVENVSKTQALGGAAEGAMKLGSSALEHVSNPEASRLQAVREEAQTDIETAKSQATKAKASEVATKANQSSAIYEGQRMINLIRLALDKRKFREPERSEELLLLVHTNSTEGCAAIDNAIRQAQNEGSLPADNRTTVECSTRLQDLLDQAEDWLKDGMQDQIDYELLGDGAFSMIQDPLRIGRCCAKHLEIHASISGCETIFVSAESTVSMEDAGQYFRQPAWKSYVPQRLRSARKIEYMTIYEFLRYREENFKSLFKGVGFYVAGLRLEQTHLVNYGGGYVGGTAGGVAQATALANGPCYWKLATLTGKTGLIKMAGLQCVGIGTGSAAVVATAGAVGQGALSAYRYFNIYLLSQTMQPIKSLPRERRTFYNLNFGSYGWLGN